MTATTPRAAVDTWPIWGHEHAVDGLRQAIASGRVGHAYAVAGPEFVGKATVATAFAQALNCQEPPAPGVPCGTCLACRKIARGVHPDVVTYSLERQAVTAERQGTQNTSLTIETVRALTAETALRPMEGRWRVSIVEDAETLQETAQEALLKTLEEPPAFMVLVLLTNDADALLPTIRSRCQIIELRPVHRSAIIAGLFADGVAPDRAEEIAGLAAGLPGWARRAAADGALIRERAEAVDRALAWIGGTGYERLVDAVRLGDGFTKRRRETYDVLQTLLGVWRDILLAHASLHGYLNHRTHLDCVEALAREWEVADIHKALRSVQACIGDLESNVRPRLAMEAMVLQWPTRSRS